MFPFPKCIFLLLIFLQGSCPCSGDERVSYPSPEAGGFTFTPLPQAVSSWENCLLTLYQQLMDLLTVENVSGKQMGFYACLTSVAAIIHIYAFQGGSLQSPTLPQIFLPMEDHGKSLWVSANISCVWDSQLFQTKMLIHNYQECKIFSDFFLCTYKAASSLYSAKCEKVVCPISLWRGLSLFRIHFT